MQAEQICPKCGKKYKERPALSREKEYKNICSMCALREAIDFLPIDVQDKIILEVSNV